MCAKCKRRVESLENHTWGRKSLKGMRNRLLKIRTFITRHYIILTSLLYRVQTLTSHDTEESENSPESPHLGEIKRMRKQCEPGASPFFLRAPGTRLQVTYHTYLASGRRLSHTPSVERVVGLIYAKQSLLVLQNCAIFRLRHAHVRKDTRLSTAFPYCKRRKAGRGLGTRLSYTSDL